MQKIKTRDLSKQSLKKLDATDIAKNYTKNMVIKTKQLPQVSAQSSTNQNEDASPENHAESTITEKGSLVAKKSMQVANEQGKKAFIRTKENATRVSTAVKERKFESVAENFDAGKKSFIKTKQTTKARATAIKPVRGKQATTWQFKKGQYTLIQKRGLKHASNQARKSKQNVKAMKRSASIAKRTARATTQAIKLAIRGTKALITAIMAGGWVAIIVILVCCLFGAAFCFFGDESSKSYTPVSAEVEGYTSTIQKYAKEEGISEYVELIKAIMMQESAGKGTDPMQASESPYNTKYSHKPGSIKDADYSILVGVKSVKDVLTKAKVESPVDMPHIRLALQGYNFGSGYIDWAVKKDKGYTVQNASDYSDMMAKKNGWAGYGDKQYVAHVLRYYPFGNYNYGVGNTVIVNIAQAQVGNKGGQKFWSWYGFKSHVEWCACFVSWCAEEGGYINSGTIPKFSFVPDGVNWFKSKGQWQKRTYEPSPGDIIFFDWEGNGGVDHVGLVKNCENGIVHTIEGNSGDQCKEKSYAVGGSVILGYGVPRY